MKHATKITFATLAIVGITACGEEKKENEATPMQNDTRMEAMEETETGNLDDGQDVGNPEFSDENLTAVYEDYIEIKSALVNTNAEEAANAAEQMTTSLQTAEAGEEGVSAAKEIAESNDINVQRTAFQDLSAAVEEMFDGALASGELYKQYCPMAFEGAGASWLSASEEIRNPYYGDKMLKCGRVEDTLQ